MNRSSNKALLECALHATLEAKLVAVRTVLENIEGHINKQNSESIPSNYCKAPCQLGSHARVRRASHPLARPTPCPEEARESKALENQPRGKTKIKSRS